MGALIAVKPKDQGMIRVNAGAEKRVHCRADQRENFRMTRSDSNGCGRSASVSREAPVSSRFDLLEPHIKHFWQAQDDILKEAQACSAKWLARHRAEAQTTANLNAGLNRAHGDLVTAVNLALGWQKGRLDRLTEDLSDWIGLCQNSVSTLSRDELDADTGVISSTDQDVSVQNVPV